MKFVQFETHSINPEAIDYYSFDGRELRIYFRSGSSLYFEGDRGVELVKLLHAAINMGRGWVK